MNVITPSLRPGARSLPAELMIPRQYRRVDWPAQRLLAGGAERMQSQGGVRGLMGVAGIGDTCYDTSSGLPYTCDSSGNPTPTDIQPYPLPPVTTMPTVIPAGDPSFNWGALANVITASSTSMAKILAASNPGTYYKDPQGNVIYSQPTGNTQNLPGIYGGSGAGAGAQGTFTSPLGSGTFGGVSSSTLMVGAVLLLAFMMMGRR